MTTQPRHLHRLLPLFDPLLGRAPLVVKTDHGPAGRLQVGHDEAYSREQLSEVELHFRHYPTCCLPTGRLIQKALVPDHGLVARSSYGPRQQLRNVALQAIIGGYADGILHASLLQRLVHLRLGKGGIGAKHHFLTQFLWCSISGNNSSAQSSALCTLPGRSFAAKQSPSALNSNSGCEECARGGGSTGGSSRAPSGNTVAHLRQ